MALQLGGSTGDRKDRIIQQQLELIRTLTANNMSRMGSDFWGPAPPSAPDPSKLTPAGAAETVKRDSPAPKTAASTGNGPAAEAAPEAPPKENIAELKAELEQYIGLDTVKREVNNLINMAQIEQKRREADLPCTDMSLHMVFSGNPRAPAKLQSPG